MPETPVGRGWYCVRQYYDRIISPAIMRPHDQFSHTFITPLNVTVPAFQYNTIHGAAATLLVSFLIMSTGETSLGGSCQATCHHGDLGIH